ncbi:MAG: carboxylating nicotinate-nucleotide diphosphorylase [candidate division Zixibacteria bacterium]
MDNSREQIKFIRLALKEDIGKGDITTRAVALKGIGRGEVIAKEKGIISGIGPFRRVFKLLSPSFTLKILKKDGQRVKPGDLVIEIKGPLDLMLIGERTSMNLLCHLSGVAASTRQYVDLIKGYRAKILDTRKTMPGMRIWEKAAVKHGGGDNHRIGLYDMYLVKENHIAAAGGLEKAIKAVIRHKKKTGARLEVEVKDLAELRDALQFNPDFIMLDNFTVPVMKKAVALARSINSKVLLEASGNVSLENVKKIAATGVDRISIGRITHSAPALDLSFKVRLR